MLLIAHIDSLKPFIHSSVCLSKFWFLGTTFNDNVRFYLQSKLHEGRIL